MRRGWGGEWRGITWSWAGAGALSQEGVRKGAEGGRPVAHLLACCRHNSGAGVFSSFFLSRGHCPGVFVIEFFNVIYFRLGARDRWVSPRSHLTECPRVSLLPPIQEGRTQDILGRGNEKIYIGTSLVVQWLKIPASAGHREFYPLVGT